MAQSMKVDIVYYKTATDFEMEFNFSGCCRMRLLTDKSSDKKTLINQLARAVSRSRVIIVTGALFGKEGIIENVSVAVGRDLVIVDNKKFGIESKDEIKIIKDSIPLVSSEGIFGGCITEQGPQTLILISENKTVRKNIMNNLIHSYVKELSATELTKGEEIIVPNSEENTTEELTSEPILDLSGEDLVFEEMEEAEVPEDIITKEENVLENMGDTELLFPETQEEALSDFDVETVPDLSGNELIFEESNNDEDIINKYTRKDELVAEEDYEFLETLDNYDLSSGVLIDDEDAALPTRKMEASGIIIEGETNSGADLIAEQQKYKNNKQESEILIDEDADYLSNTIKANEKIFEKKIADSKELFIDSDEIYSLTGDNAQNKVTNNADKEEYVTDNDEEEDKTIFYIGRGINLPIIIISVILLAVVAVLVYCLFIVSMTNGSEATQYIEEAFGLFFG